MNEKWKKALYIHKFPDLQSCNEDAKENFKQSKSLADI